METADASTQTEDVGQIDEPGDDPGPVMTLDMAFENTGILGGSRLGRFYIYPYAVVQTYCVALPNPIDWPPAKSVIMDATFGTVICRVEQLRIKGFVATGDLQMRLFLNISGRDLEESLDLPACDIVGNVEFLMSRELQQIAIRDELVEEVGEEIWVNPLTNQRIDLRVHGKYLIMWAQGAPANIDISRTAREAVCRCAGAVLGEVEHLRGWSSELRDYEEQVHVHLKMGGGVVV